MTFTDLLYYYIGLFEHLSSSIISKKITIFFSFHYSSCQWPPNSVGVEVTQWREDGHLLGAAEAVNHAAQLLAVHYPVVPFLPHVEKTGQQSKSPLLMFWNLFHS